MTFLISTANSEMYRNVANVQQGSDIPLDNDDDVINRKPPSPLPDSYSGVVLQVGDVGASTDPDIPLIYCSRLLCSSFLLTGTKGDLMPEQHARVSVKSLALGCLAGVVSLYPQAFFLPLFKDNSVMPDTDPGKFRFINLLF